MLLLDPSTLSTLVSASCGGRDSGESRDMVSVLRRVTPRVEEALNVATLTRGVYTDSFFLPGSGSRDDRAGLRLSNGFVVPDSVTVIDPNGNPVSSDVMSEDEIDYRYGVIHISQWMRGRYKVRYTSGFEPADLPASPPDWMTPDDRVLKDVPDWIEALVANFAVLWFRTARISPKVNEKISYGQVDAAIRKEITARLYPRYQRPRVGLYFSDRMDNG